MRAERVRQRSRGTLETCPTKDNKGVLSADDRFIAVTAVSGRGRRWRVLIGWWRYGVATSAATAERRRAAPFATTITPARLLATHLFHLVQQPINFLL